MFKFDGAEDRLGGVEGGAALGESQLEEHVVDQITVTRHGHRYLLVACIRILSYTVGLYLKRRDRRSRPPTHI